MNLVIYGAQAIALGTYEAIHNLYPQREIQCFLVTKLGTNSDKLAGLSVMELSNYSNMLSQAEKDNTEILIATPENVMPEIERSLEDEGFHCHVRLTSDRFSTLCSFNNVCDKSFIPLSALPVGYHQASMHVFMAKFYKDIKLTLNVSRPEWITPIQVGASLCEERVANILDCDGENISDRNVNYSELTALYWMWKNRLISDWSKNQNEYYGLCHYRRYLDLSEDDVLRLLDNDVDVVLPFPMPYDPNIEEHHKRYLKDEDWQAVRSALIELQPEYAEKFPDILKQKYFYNYNIIIARKEVLADYCSWLFPILARVEELSIPKGCDRSDRYIGYMGESLSTLYFMTNKDELNITHAGCKFLI